MSMKMIHSDKIMKRAGEIYCNLCAIEGSDVPPVIRSRQVKALCWAMCEAVNNAAHKKGKKRVKQQPPQQ